MGCELDCELAFGTAALELDCFAALSMNLAEKCIVIANAVKQSRRLKLFLAPQLLIRRQRLPSKRVQKSLD